MQITIDVSHSGPLFDGRATREVKLAIEDAQQAVGNQGLADVHRLLDLSIRHPTPYYETQILVERQANDVVVHDRGIVYGPWLEGVGSRNRTTRFKGYFSFRRAKQALDGKVPGITERVLQQHLGGMQ